MLADMLLAASPAHPPAAVLAGRLHVVLVHFPIALVFSALMLEMVSAARGRGLSPAGVPCLALGALGAVAAAASGLLNANLEQGDPGPTLLTHRTLGLVAAGLAAIALICRLWLERSAATRAGPRLATRASLLLAAIGVGAAGHFGGSVTHGEQYLTGPLRDMLGIAPPAGPAPAPTRPAPVITAPASGDGGGAVDFAREVWPILDQWCIDCHGDAVRKGRLRLDSRAAVLAGGKNGPSIKPGDAAGSLFMKRILGEGGEPRMPLDEEPLTEDEIAALRRWIDAGAPWPSPAR
ncbi:MAG: hypothetical protein KIT68_01235 [Phycisphaeraceae bacterium]|nr:hypothetical protein [Phycisphaeraceae bacterium]